MAAAGSVRAKVQPDEEMQSETLTLKELIRRRAYEIWLRRGERDGTEVVDWLDAEDEIRGEM